MRDREVSCIYYACEHECLKGREGTFYHYCQTCDKYQPKKGTAPARKNLRRQKLEDLKKTEMKKIINDL